MAEKRDETYVIHKEDGRRYAVPTAKLDDFKTQGFVVDPDGPSAADVAPRTVKAAEKAITTAQAKKEAAAEKDAS